MRIGGDDDANRRILRRCSVLGLPRGRNADGERRGEGDTHIDSIGVETTIDCNDATLFVNGSWNVITATGTCYAVTMQGSEIP